MRPNTSFLHHSPSNQPKPICLNFTFDILSMKGAILNVISKNEHSNRLMLPPPSTQCQAYSNTNALLSSKSRRLGPRISETVKGKLRLGAKIIQSGGINKIFRRAFSVREGEVLIKASPCYLYTTAGPIAGMIFISTDKVAFCSDRSIKLITNSSGETLRFHYKVVIPVEKVKNVGQSVNVKRPNEKYLHVVTNDEFEFWFMGLVSYERTFECLKNAISQGCH